jgi:hypothetical protein
MLVKVKDAAGGKPTTEDVPVDGQDRFFREKTLEMWSGRRGSNPQPPAWEADALPLSYSRSAGRVYRKVPQRFLTLFRQKGARLPNGDRRS